MNLEDEYNYYAKKRLKFNILITIGLIAGESLIPLSFWLLGWKMFVGVLLFRLGELSCRITWGIIVAKRNDPDMEE